MFSKNKNKRTKILYLLLIMLFVVVGFSFANQVFAQDNLGVDIVGEQTGLGNGDIRTIIGSIIKVFLGLVGTVALVIFLYGGFLYMTSGGSDDKVGKAKKWMINGVIGLVIIFSAYAITTFVLSRLSDATGFNANDNTGGDTLPIIIGSESQLIVTGVSPQGNGMPINSKLNISFSKSLNPATVTSENIKITKIGEKEIVTTQIVPDSAVESNGNEDIILPEIIADDSVYNSGWVVCSIANGNPLYLGDDKMVLHYNVAEVNHEQALSVKLAFDLIAAGDRAYFDISCGPTEAIARSKQYYIADEYKTESGESKLDIPSACYDNSDDIYVYLKRVGSNCIKFDYAFVEVENEEFVAGEETEIAGSFALSGDGATVTFTPDKDCQDEVCSGQKCFDANTKVSVRLNEGGVKAIAGSYSLLCSVGSLCNTEFTTNAVCDVTAPSVNFMNLINGSKVSENFEYNVLLKSVDDGGISYTSLFEDELSPALGVNVPQGNITPRLFETSIYWDTYDYELRSYILKAETEDVVGQIGTKSISVKVLPEYCFDGNGQLICDSDGSKPECGACDGTSCTNDDQCAGICRLSCADEDNIDCANDSDCEEGVACEGMCVTVPEIVDIAPISAGPGNLVTIVGVGFLQKFGNENQGRIYFSGPNGTYLEAGVACDPNSSWGPNRIIAKVPTGAVTGPIKVVNYLGQVDTTDDDEKGYLGDFIVDPTINYPGLCSIQLQGCTPGVQGDILVTCNQGAISNTVKASGENFGTTKENDDNVTFGLIGALYGEGQWTNTQITGIEVPSLADGSYNVYVDKGLLCKDSEGSLCSEGSESCVCKSVVSNPALFQVIPSANFPVIESVNPDTLHIGQMFNVNGLYFGDKVGFVEVHTTINGYSYDWPAVFGCNKINWNNEQIIIKIPENIANELPGGTDPYSLDYSLILYTADGLVSAPFDINISDGEPTPGICSIDPNNGPVGTGVNVFGEYFGNQGGYILKFSANGGTLGEVDSGVAVSSFNEWSAEQILNAVVPAGAKSGGVFLEKDDGSDRSNTYIFNVGSCTPGSCSNGEECCATGICQTSGSCEEEFEYLPSEYMWVLSTGPLPEILAVLERTCLPGAYSQSPSPYRNSSSACINGTIGFTFSLPVEPTTLSNNIVVKRCLNSTGVKCDLNACSSTENSVVPGVCISRIIQYFNQSTDYASETLNYSCQNSSGAVCQPDSEGCICVGSGQALSRINLYSSLKDSNNNTVSGGINPGLVDNIDNYLFPNTWYEITVRGGYSGVRAPIGTTATSTSKYMVGNYKWSFLTKEEICIPENLLLTPLVGLINELYGNAKYIVSGQYQCQDIALVDENWDWQVATADQSKVQFAGYACSEFNPYSPVSATNHLICTDPTNSEKYIGYYKLKVDENPANTVFESLPWDPYEISVSAVPGDADLAALFDSLYKKGFLQVKFQKPKVIRSYPNCDEACINTAITANFNIEMDDTTLNSSTVKIYSCFSSDCTSLSPVENLNIQYNSGTDFTEGRFFRTLIGLNNGVLSPNTYYRVVLTNGIKSSSQVVLSNLNYATAGAPDGDCSDNLDNDGDGGIDVTGGYIEGEGTELDYVCGCYSEGEFVGYAELTAQLVCPENSAITCQNLSNDDFITDSALLSAIKQNSTYYKPDNQCTSADTFEVGATGAYDAFSWIFKTKNDDTKCQVDRVELVPKYYISEKVGERVEYWTEPYSMPNQCDANGQLLTPFDYDWTWESQYPVIATVLNLNLGANVQPYCNDKCQVTGGEPYAAVCGDNKIDYDLGEECDGGNDVPGDGCSDICLTEPIISTDCGNGIVDAGEECDDGTSGSPACTSTCLNKGTTQGYECGNGIVEPGEDDDKGSNNAKSGLSSLCLHTGSKYKSSEIQNMALCGDGRIDIGEECEAVCLDDLRHECTTGDDCVCSIENNPLCTNKCVWKGFPSCDNNCTKSESCHSGDPSCNQVIEACTGGAGCLSTMQVPCNEGAVGCSDIGAGVFKKTITCEIDQTEGCNAPGTRLVQCYAGQTCDTANHVGIKNINCEQCQSSADTFKVSCLIGTAGCVADPLAGNQTIYGKKVINCSECTADNVYPWACQLTEADTCIENLKTVNCNSSDPACSCNNCCGNGVRENYLGGGGSSLDPDEDCEAECKYLGPDGASCIFGTANCVCTFPEYCSTSCINKGSQTEYGSYCQDGNTLFEPGEDPECEYDLSCDPSEGNTCPAGAIKGAPYDVATVIPSGNVESVILTRNNENAYIFEYNVVTNYIQAVTNISANMIEDASPKTGFGKLKYRTNDPYLINKYKDILPNVSDYSDTPGTKKQCNNLLDDDSDTLVDLDDTCCESSEDDSEGGSCENVACSDGLDNDGDGFCDYGAQGCTCNYDNDYCGTHNSNTTFLPRDPGCQAAGDTSELDEIGNCSDGRDNDGDGLFDFCEAGQLCNTCDPDCTSPTDGENVDNSQTPAQCSDGQDNDGDGAIDYPADPQCSSCGDNSEEDTIEICESSASIDNNHSHPYNNETDVCLNSQVLVAFDQQVVLPEGSVYFGFSGSCPDISYEGGFFNKTYQKVKMFVKNMFVKVGLAEAGYCEVEQEYSISESISGDSIVTITPSATLLANKEYLIKFEDLENSCGENLGDISSVFVTGNEICRVDNVAVTPGQTFVTKPNTQTVFNAIARKGNQPIVESPGVYEWVYDWKISDESLILGMAGCADYIYANGAGVCYQDAQQPLPDEAMDYEFVEVVSNNKNGTANISANVVIVVDKIAEEMGTFLGQELSSVGEKTTGNAKYQVLLCDNLWEPSAYAPDPDNNGENRWGKFTNLISTGEYQTTYIYEKNFNVGLFYCRDFGNPGFADDLPKVDIGLGEFITKEVTPRYGIYFDRNQDYVQVSDSNLGFMSSESSPNNDWMIESWVYHEGYADSKFSRLFYKNLDQDPSTNNHVQLAFRYWGENCDNGCEYAYGNFANTNNCTGCTDKRSIVYSIKTNGAEIVRTTQAGAGLLSGGFNHIALSFDGVNTSHLYVNGEEVATVPDEFGIDDLNYWPVNLTEPPSPGYGYSDLYIGGLGKTGTASVSLAGFVDEFSVWDTDDLAPNLNKIIDPTSEPNLKGLWTFDDNVLDVTGNNRSVAHCSLDDMNSKCLSGDFYHMNLTELAKDQGFFVESQLPWVQLSGDFQNQCNDGIDNDGDGEKDYNADTWIGDPKCKSYTDPWEEPELFEQYFFIRVNDKVDPSTGLPYPTNDYAADAISLRIYENSENLPPEIWYQKYAPNPTPNPNKIALDCQEDDFGKFCYDGVQDGATVYVASSNVAETNGQTENRIYNNIYVLGYTLNANEATKNIYAQMVNLLWFNTNMVTNQGVQPEKSKLIRDTRRIMDMVLMRQYLNIYKSTHNGQVPQLASGTYVRGRTFSSWPSWQNEFGNTLQQSLPVDPLNHFKWVKTNVINTGAVCEAEQLEPGEQPNRCPVEFGGNPSDYQCVIPGEFCSNCPIGYDKLTCYNSELQRFFNYYDEDPFAHYVYSFRTDPFATGNSSAFDLKFALEISGPAYDTYKFIVTPSFDSDDWISPALPPDNPEEYLLGQCSDGIDNDGNGFTDYSEIGGDPGCDSITDSLEDFDYICNDGWDNDGDGTCDFAGCDDCTASNNYCNTYNSSVQFLPADPSCDSAFDRNETYPTQCSDGIDNDGDYLIDYCDPSVQTCVNNDQDCKGPYDDYENKKVLFTFFADTSGSMQTYDPDRVHQDIIKKMINGIDKADGTHINGIDDVFGENAYYMLETSRSGDLRKEYYPAGNAENFVQWLSCSENWENCIDSPATCAQTYNCGEPGRCSSVSCENNSQCASGFCQKVCTTGNCQNKCAVGIYDKCASPYNYNGAAQIASRVEQTYNDGRYLYNFGEVKNSVPVNFSHHVYVVLTDADDYTEFENRANTIGLINTNRTPFHLFYIRSINLDETDLKYQFWHRYHGLCAGLSCSSDFDCAGDCVNGICQACTDGEGCLNVANGKRCSAEPVFGLPLCPTDCIADLNYQGVWLQGNPTTLESQLENVMLNIVTLPEPTQIPEDQYIY